jgi:CoA:oxalate CoA-transferase
MWHPAREEHQVQVLDQIRVVELGDGVSLAFAGKLFADFGADVIKVEAPGGDSARHEGPFPHDVPNTETSASFGFFNRNKRGVVLELDTAGGLTTLADLAASADLVLSSLSLRELADLGLTVEGLGAARPGIVLASLTPFGEEGPYAGFAATALIADAIAGPMSVSGMPGHAPLSKPMNVVAAQVGNAFASSAMAAVFAAQHGADAQSLQVSATDTLMTCFDRRAISHMVYQLTGDVVARPFGGSAGGVLPAGRHACADGDVIIATLPIWVPRMLVTLADPELTAFVTEHPDALARPELADLIGPALTRWLSERTRAECFQSATLEHGWPVYPLYEPRDVVADKHFIDRDCFVEFDHPVAGKQLQLGAPWRMGEGGFEARRPAPTLGQHTAEVLEGLGVASALGEI